MTILRAMQQRQYIKKIHFKLLKVMSSLKGWQWFIILWLGGITATLLLTFIVKAAFWLLRWL